MMEFVWNEHGMSNRTFLLPDNLGYVLFTNTVLQQIYRNAQTHTWHREAGGQLFSPAPHESAVVVSVATGPHPRDVRGRQLFVPDLLSATNDRQMQFDQGRHAVGLWHTHPESTPSPSTQDYETTLKYLEAFHGAMNGFLLVILGNRGNPLNMAVWVVTAEPFGTWIQLVEA